MILYKKQICVCLFLYLLYAGSMFAQTDDNYQLTGFPSGFSPEEIGDRLVKKYLSLSLTDYGDIRETPAPVKIAYPHICTWLGSLWYADNKGDQELYNRLTERFLPLFDTEKHLQPNANHVDNSIFGAVPLNIYKKKKEPEYLKIGLVYADSQWELPENASDKQKEWMSKGYTWQTRLWIDDMFMINALQTQAYLATMDKKYIDRAAEEMKLYINEIQLPNGLFHHSPSAPFFWGRGNGWMAAGMTEILKTIPEDNPNKNDIMNAYVKMMETLLKYQTDNGMWRQLIDDPSSWEETSCTGMFLYAFITGVKKGWLDEKIYGAAVRKGWISLVRYINANDEVMEICQGTSARNNYQYYIDRKRVIGYLLGQAPVIWCSSALLEK